MSDPKLKVVVEVDGKQYAAELDKLDQKTESLGNTSKESAAGVSHLAGAMKYATTAAVAYLSLDMVKHLLNEADAYKQLQARVKGVTKETGDYLEVSRELYRLSQANGAALSDTATLFSSLARVAPELHATNTEMLTLTNLVQQLGVISGASDSAMSAGLMQFGQGLAGGVLRAEEFNSILENIPEVAVRIAKGMGMTVGQLRAAVLDGKVLSHDVFDALMRQSEEISKEFREMPLSIGRAGQMFDNSFQKLVATIDNAAGATSTWANFLKDAADSMDRIAANLSENELQKLERQRAGVMVNWLKQQEEHNQKKSHPIYGGLFTNDVLWEKNRAVTMKLIDDLDQQIIELNKRQLAMDASKPKPKPSGSRTGGSAAKTDFEEAQAYGKYMYELAHQAYPEATQSAEEYGEAMAKLLVAQTEAANSAYYDRLAAAEQVVRDNYTATELYTDAMIRLNAQWQAGDISTETYIAALGKAKKEMGDFGKKGDDTFKQLESAVRGWGNAFTDTFADMVMDGKASFSDLADSIIRDLLRIQIQQNITQPLVDGGTSWLNGLFSGGSAGAASSTGAVVAHSGAIIGRDGGHRVVDASVFAGAPRYHTGGIAGDEVPAILKRGEGVFTREQMRALGGPQNVRIQIENRGAPKEAQQANVGFDAQGMFISFMLDDQRRSGPITKGFEQRWNLRQGAR